MAMRRTCFMVQMVMALGIAMMMGSVRAAIRPSFGVEYRFHLGYLRAQPFQHLADHVIAADQQPVRLDLCRQVTIADLPGQREEVATIPAAHFMKALGLRTHLDYGAIGKEQSVAVTQEAGFGKIEQKGYHRPARCPV